MRGLQTTKDSEDYSRCLDCGKEVRKDYRLCVKCAARRQETYLEEIREALRKSKESRR